MKKIVVAIIALCILAGCNGNSYEDQMSVYMDEFFHVVYDEEQPIKLFEDSPEEHARSKKLIELTKKIGSLTPPDKYKKEHNDVLIMVKAMATYTIDSVRVLNGNGSWESEMEMNKFVYQNKKEELASFLDKIQA